MSPAIDVPPPAIAVPGGDAAPVTARQRWSRVAGAAAAVGVTAYIGLVDPAAGGGIFPACPTRTLFGIDCPACGGLRGTHDLLHGDVVGALDHNLLLPVLLAAYAVALVLWLLPLVGRRTPRVHLPPWALVATVAVAAAFTLLRNLPIAGLEFLASGA